MTARRVRLVALMVIATAGAVAASIMANYSGPPSNTQVAWLVSAVLFASGGCLAQVAHQDLWHQKKSLTLHMSDIKIAKRATR